MSDKKINTGEKVTKQQAELVEIVGRLERRRAALALAGLLVNRQIEATVAALASDKTEAK